MGRRSKVKQQYNLQVEVKDRRDGEASMNVPNNMAFLYFPKNYTKNLIEFINNRGNHDNASQMFAYLTKESKYRYYQ